MKTATPTKLYAVRRKAKTGIYVQEFEAFETVGAWYRIPMPKNLSATQLARLLKK